MSTTGTAEPTTDFSLMMLEDFEFDVPCDSGRCEEVHGRGAHAAHWIVKLSCGDDLAWCKERMDEYESTKQAREGVTCQVCNDPHGKTVIAKVPIRGS